MTPVGSTSTRTEIRGRAGADLENRGRTGADLENRGDGVSAATVAAPDPEPEPT